MMEDADADANWRYPMTIRNSRTEETMRGLAGRRQGPGRHQLYVVDWASRAPDVIERTSDTGSLFYAGSW